MAHAYAAGFKGDLYEIHQNILKRREVQEDSTDCSCGCDALEHNLHRLLRKQLTAIGYEVAAAPYCEQQLEVFAVVPLGVLPDKIQTDIEALTGVRFEWELADVDDVYIVSLEIVL